MRMYALQITEEEMERKRDYAFCDRYRSVKMCIRDRTGTAGYLLAGEVVRDILSAGNVSHS